MGINSGLIFFFRDSNVRDVKRPKSFTYHSEELVTERSILSFTFTAPPKMTQADFEVWTSRIKTQMYASHKTPALLLCKPVASAGSWLGTGKSSAAQFQFTCVKFGKKSKLGLRRKRIQMFSIPRKEHMFLQMGLNFKASGQRQLNEAGFQTA